MQETEQNTIPELENSPPENIHTAERLKELQALPLERKIQITKSRIIEWYKYWNGQVYVSFSGGKDSTVLLHLVREIFPDIEAVYVDTGLEYPELRQFVKTFDNVTWLKPEMNFRQVLDVYGYPLISKEVADNVYRARHGSKNAIDRMNGLNPDGSLSSFKKTNIKYKYLLNAPFEISNKCCNEMKKKPSKAFEKRTGYKAIVGTMAVESTYRKTGWIITGCNAFDTPRPISQPMAFWTEQDVLEYCIQNKIQLSYLFPKNKQCCI